MPAAAAATSELASLVTPAGKTMSSPAVATTARPPEQREPLNASAAAGAAEFSPVAAAPQVALELAGDGIAARLGQVRRVLGLFKRPDVLCHLGILLGELVDPALPGACLLGKVGERQRHVENILDPPQESQGGLRAWRLCHVVRHGGPERHGGNPGARARMREDADDPR